MCSRDPVDLETHNASTKEISSTCRKCSTPASVVLQTKFSYCRSCFMEYFKHKFRATLGKSKIMKHGDKILVGFSGTASSLCLIDLIRDSLNDEKKKKMSFEVNVLFIDESSAYDCDKIKHPDFNEIKCMLGPYNFKLYATNLGAYLANDINLDVDNLHKECKLDVIKILFMKTQSLSAKTDLLVKIRNNILFKVANEMGCQKIFTGETSDHLAINTIANIVQGRGGQLPQDIGFCHELKSVKLLRPLQDCSKKEVTFYNVFNNLTPITSYSFGTKGDKYSSIQRLCDTFIMDLQNSFPSTVLTVHATGNKLSTISPGRAENSNCCLCQGKVDESKSPLTAEEASHVSRMTSSLGPLGFDNSILLPEANLTKQCESPCSSNDGCCQNTNNVDDTFDKRLQFNICYGCQLILKDCESLSSLPSEFLNKLQRKTQFNRMHNEIKSFLL